MKWALHLEIENSNKLQNILNIMYKLLKNIYITPISLLQSHLMSNGSDDINAIHS